eukprot:2008088-Rhodomonas_salina.1
MSLTRGCRKLRRTSLTWMVRSAMPMKRMNGVQRGVSSEIGGGFGMMSVVLVLAEVSAGDGAECQVQVKRAGGCYLGQAKECCRAEGVHVRAHGLRVGEPVLHGGACGSWRAGSERGEEGSAQ